MRRFSILVPAIALLGALAACNTSAMGPGAGTTSTAPAPLPDGTLTAQMGGSGIGTLIVANGAPTGYEFQGTDGSVYNARSVRRLSNGDIGVDAARISEVEIGPDSISGTWQLRGSVFPVTFRQ